MKRTVSVILLAFTLIFALGGCMSVGKGVVGKWKTVSPENHGVDSYVSFKSDGTFKTCVTMPDGDLTVETGEYELNSDKGLLMIFNVRITDEANEALINDSGEYFIKNNWGSEGYTVLKKVDIAAVGAGDSIVIQSQDTANFGDIVTRTVRSVKTTVDGERGFVTYDAATGIEDETVATEDFVLGTPVCVLQCFDATAKGDFDLTEIEYTLSGKKLTIGEGFEYRKA